MNKMDCLKKWWLFILMVTVVACHSSKHSLKQLQKGKHEQVRASLDKKLLKDSLNPAAHYIYSLLFVDTAYQQYTVDSAYHHILLATDDYQAVDLKDRQKLAKSIALDSASLLRQRLLTDSLAFGEAADTNTGTTYQRFIDRHGKQAPQYEEAIRRRDQLAFNATRQQDTYQAYKTFMDTYPAARQFEQAKERYNTLIFRAKTKGGNLDSYVNFLKSFPNTPYRAQAEEQILRISAADNLPAHYASFARQYPKSKHARQAVNLLYHVYKACNPDRFLQDYPNIPFADSLRKVIALEHTTLVPVLEDNRYGFIDTKGNTAIKPQYPMIPQSYLCQGVTHDFVHVADVRNNKLLHHILTKKGQTVFSVEQQDTPESLSGSFTADHITAIGMGWLLVQQDDPHAYTLWHQSGYRMMPEGYDALDTVVLMPAAAAVRQQVPFEFIKFQANGLWGLMTFGGITLLEAAYDDIEEYNQFVVLEQHGKMAVTNRKALLQKANNAAFAPKFAYEDVAPTGDRFLIAYNGAYEIVLDEQLQPQVPSGKYNIVQHIDQQRWLLKKETTRQFVRNDSLISIKQPAYFLYSARTGTRPKEYDKAYYNERWLALQSKKGFEFLDLHVPDSVATYDSVKLLSEHVALLFQPDTVIAYFSAQHQKKLARFDRKKEIQFRLVSAVSAANFGRQQQYLLVIRPGTKQLLNMQGSSLFASSMDEITAYPQSLFVIDKNRRKGIVDSLGHNLVPIRYQSIGNEQQGTLAVFDRQKFGFYHHASQTFVEPAYEAIVQPYGQLMLPQDSTLTYLFVARKNGKYGIINQQNKPLTAFGFDEISYWTDSTALGRTGEEWQVFRIFLPTKAEESQRILFSGIQDFEVITSDTASEKLMKIYQERMYGIISNTQGRLLPTAYDEILAFGNGEARMFMTEKYVPEAELYIVVYLDASGSILKKQALTTEQYDKLYCDAP